MYQPAGNQVSGRLGTPVMDQTRGGRRQFRPFAEGLLAEAQRTRPAACSGGDERGAPAVELWALHLRYAREHERTDLESLVDEYRGLALTLARRMYRGGEPLEELCQVAMEALVRALQSFDPERGVPFVGYAMPSILGRLKRHFRDQGWSIRISREDQRLHQASVQVRAELQAVRGREPSEVEVGERLGRRADELWAADLAVAARSTQSLDERTADGPPFHERLGGDDNELQLAEQRVDLQRALAILDRRACDLLYLYFWRRLSQAAIAERYGTHQVQVSRWLARAIGQLRNAMTG